MDYKYGQNINYEDFSSGRVLYGEHGVTNFPVRLAQEIYGRCLQYLVKKKEICLYDCCCGAGYLLTVLGFLNQDTISDIIGSDINEKAVTIARKNLSLLSVDGINHRIEEIRALYQLYHKQSHYEAEISAIKLKGMLKTKIISEVFVGDALSNIDVTKKPDIIIVDIPYGELVSWVNPTNNSLDSLLDNIEKIIHTDTVIGICMDKKQKISSEKFIQMESRQIGKRKFVILKKNDGI